MTLDLEQPIVGYRARKSYRPIDLAAIGRHDPEEFFEPIPRPKGGALFLSREAFYIFSTHERVRVPPEFAVEMLPYDTSAGEFRAHYAGFFDPGFGFGATGEILGTPAVLEVRPYEDDLIVRHRQPVCKMAYERLVAPPHKLYGVGVHSHYAEQRGPRMSKFFR
jgi:dCTP deaminase